jgi:hypothetical protein
MISAWSNITFTSKKRGLAHNFHMRAQREAFLQRYHSTPPAALVRAMGRLPDTTDMFPLWQDVPSSNIYDSTPI